MLVYMWLWNKNISVVGNKISDVLFGSAHRQRACVGSVCLSIILWIPLENTRHTKWVLNRSFKTSCLGKKTNQPNARVAHQDRESPRSARAAPLGELRLHPSFSSNHLEVEENDGFRLCFISFQHANSATSSSTLEASPAKAVTSCRFWGESRNRRGIWIYACSSSCWPLEPPAVWLVESRSKETVQADRIT